MSENGHNPKRELSPREQEILRYLAEGHSYQKIAEQIGLSPTTVNTYVRRLYERLQVSSRAEAVQFYLNPGGN